MPSCGGRNVIERLEGHFRDSMKLLTVTASIVLHPPDQVCVTTFGREHSLQLQNLLPAAFLLLVRRLQAQMSPKSPGEGECGWYSQLPCEILIGSESSGKAAPALCSSVRLSSKASGLIVVQRGDLSLYFTLPRSKGGCLVVACFSSARQPHSIP